MLHLVLLRYLYQAVVIVIIWTSLTRMFFFVWFVLMQNQTFAIVQFASKNDVCCRKWFQLAHKVSSCFVIQNPWLRLSQWCLKLFSYQSNTYTSFPKMNMNTTFCWSMKYFERARFKVHCRFRSQPYKNVVLEILN